MVQPPGGAREGAYPWPYNSSPNVQGRHWTFLSGFHMYFMARAVFALQETCLAFPAEQSPLNRILTFYADVHTGARTVLSGYGGEAFPGYPIVTRGTSPQTDTALTKAEVVAGAGHHRLVVGFSGATYGSEQIEKLGWVCAYAARRFPTQRDFYLQLLGEGYGLRVKGQTYEVAFANLYGGGPGVAAQLTWLFQVTSSTAGNNVGCYGEHTWRMPWMAEVLNLIS